MIDLSYRRPSMHIPGVMARISWWRSDRIAVHFRGTGWILACPIDAFELRHATMLEF